MAEVEKPLGQTESDDPRRALINRITASESFAKSPRLRELLTYLVECAFRDPQSPVTEQQVGVAVFNRAAGYDTSSDTVVRVQASEVRKRLKYYFLSEGLSEPLVMELPRGSYLPIFNSRWPLEAGREEEAPISNGQKLMPVLATATPLGRIARPREIFPQAKPARPIGMFVLASLLGVAVIACAWFAYQNAQLRKRSAEAEATPFLGHFWKQFFQNERQTEIVPSDFDLIVISDVIGRNVPLKEYSSKDYPKSLIDPLIKDQKINYFVSKAANAGAITPNDGPILHDLSLMSERYQVPFLVISPRQVRVDSDYPGNFILLGHERSNPWVEPFENRMNFRHQYDDAARKATIVNTSPLPGEKPVYTFENHKETYAVVACLPKPDGRGNTLLLFGIGLSNIDGAGHLVTDEAAMAKLYSRLGIGLSDRIPYFEVLLEKKPTAQNYEIVAHRIISNP
jgi:hypothetical protein